MHQDLIQFIEKKDLQSIRGALRQAFIRSKYKKAFIDSKRIETIQYKKCGQPAKRKAVNYRCVKCLELFKGDAINVDHIKAIGSWTDIREFYVFFLRMWCEFSNLQILCKPCHKRKTRFDRMTFN